MQLRSLTKFTFPPSLEKYNVPLQDYLDQHRPDPATGAEKYNGIVVGAIIYDSSNASGAAVLLVQRSRTEYAFPLKWESPGGGVEFSDTTILHGLAREVFEETGLRVRHVECQVGSGVDFLGGERPGGQPRRRFWRGTWVVRVENESEGGNGGDELNVRLAPAEHEQYQWADEAKVHELAERGEITTSEMYDVLKLAFGGGS